MVMKKQKEDNKNIFTLPISGKTVEMTDVKKADGHMLMKARMIADTDISAGIYILSQLCKIDGNDVTVDDILDLDMEDVVAIEDVYLKLKKKLKLTRRK